MRPSSPVLSVSLVSLLCLALAGCSLSTTAAPSPETGAAIQGIVHGGQNPIIGAHVYLLAVNAGVFTPNASGYGNASLSLLTSGTGRTLDTSGGPTNGFYYVTTVGPGGTFNISNDYTCTGGQEVYLYALGGDPGLGSGTNPAAGLMAALGTCPGATGSTGNTLSSGITVVMNEVSTVAAAYALAGFATDATHVSSSGTAAAKAGLTNAFINAAILETLSTGVANADPPPGVGYYGGGGIVPQTEINTLGNILAACVNSNGTVSACTTLFANAESGGTTGTQPTDTATAAINIAHNPVAAVGTLYGLSSAYQQFAPALIAQPNDFTVSILYENEILAGFTDQTAGPLAIDASGDIWSANNVVDEINNQGYDYTVSQSYLGLGGYSGFSGAVNIAIDVNGNAWAISSDALGKFNNTGTLLSPSGGYTGLGLSSPTSIAMDASSNAWIGNTSGGNVVKVSSSGVLSGTYTGTGMSQPGPVAIDASGNAWVADRSSGAINKLSPTGALTSYTAATLTAPTGIAIDHSGNVWVSNSSSVAEISSSGTLVSPAAGYSNSSTTGLLGVAIDGAGNAWIAGGSSIDEISSTGTILSGSTGFASSNNVDSIVVDASGDVWTNYVSCSYSFLYGEECSVLYQEVVGAGAPVVIPLALGVKNNTLGTRP